MIGLEPSRTVGQPVVISSPVQVVTAVPLKEKSGFSFIITKFQMKNRKIRSVVLRSYGINDLHVCS